MGKQGNSSVSGLLFETFLKKVTCCIWPAWAVSAGSSLNNIGHLSNQVPLRACPTNGVNCGDRSVSNEQHFMCSNKHLLGGISASFLEIFLQLYTKHCSAVCELPTNRVSLVAIVL